MFGGAQVKICPKTLHLITVQLRQILHIQYNIVVVHDRKRYCDVDATALNPCFLRTEGERYTCDGFYTAGIIWF